jgi:hypothetical protein
LQQPFLGRAKEKLSRVSELECRSRRRYRAAAIRPTTRQPNPLLDTPPLYARFILSTVISDRSFISPSLGLPRRAWGELATTPQTRSYGGPSMLDILYLALGLGLFALLGLYARWAANA